jgi:hypothetical protein
MKILKKAALVGAAATAIVLGVAGSAQAGTDAFSDANNGTVKFVSYGDKFVVCDTFADGLSVYNEYKYIRIDGTVQHDVEYNNGGSGTCATYDHNFGEGRSVTFRACLDVPYFVDTCGGWRVGIA